MGGGSQAADGASLESWLGATPSGVQISPSALGKFFIVRSMLASICSSSTRGNLFIRHETVALHPCSHITTVSDGLTTSHFYKHKFTSSLFRMTFVGATNYGSLSYRFAQHGKRRMYTTRSMFKHIIVLSKKASAWRRIVTSFRSSRLSRRAPAPHPRRNVSAHKNRTEFPACLLL